jgi:hypothetical protein
MTVLVGHLAAEWPTTYLAIRVGLICARFLLDLVFFAHARTVRNDVVQGHPQRLRSCCQYPKCNHLGKRHVFPQVVVLPLITATRMP